MSDRAWLGVLWEPSIEEFLDGLGDWTGGSLAVCDRDGIARLRALLDGRVGDRGVLRVLEAVEALYDQGLKDVILHSLTIPNAGALDPEVREDIYPSLRFAATVAGPPGWWKDAARAVWGVVSSGP